MKATAGHEVAARDVTGHKGLHCYWNYTYKYRPKAFHFRYVPSQVLEEPPIVPTSLLLALAHPAKPIGTQPRDTYKERPIKNLRILLTPRYVLDPAPDSHRPPKSLRQSLS